MIETMLQLSVSPFGSLRLVGGEILLMDREDLRQLKRQCKWSSVDLLRMDNEIVWLEASFVGKIKRKNGMKTKGETEMSKIKELESKVTKMKKEIENLEKQIVDYQNNREGEDWTTAEKMYLEQELLDLISRFNIIYKRSQKGVAWATIRAFERMGFGKWIK